MLLRDRVQYNVDVVAWAEVHFLQYCWLGEFVFKINYTVDQVLNSRDCVLISQREVRCLSQVLFY